MKRSEFHGKRVVHHEQAMGYYCRGGESCESAAARKRADLDVEAAEAAGVTWDPEAPCGFEAWWLSSEMNGKRLSAKTQETALLAWNACLARQEARRLAEPTDREPDGAAPPWHAGMSFDEIRRAIQQGVAPGSRDPAGYVTVPTGYLSWMARRDRQEAQGRTISPEVDPEVRRKEIEAQIEAWAFASDKWYGEEYQPSKVGWVRRGRDLAQRLGVL